MKKSLTFSIIGGDMRQIFLAKQLYNDGHNVTTFAIDRYQFSKDIKITNVSDFSMSNIIIFPIQIESKKGNLNAPLCNTSYKTSEIFNLLNPKTYVLGGNIPNYLINQSKRNKLFIFDYLKREELAIGNAIPTCEGAIELAMHEMSSTLHGSNVLIIGNGKIGSKLSILLSSLNSNVTVAARNPKDFAKISSSGLKHINTNSLYDNVKNFDLIINTVPTLMLTSKELSQVKEDCIIIDLASNAGGTDFKAAEQLGKRAIHALSLPGKVAPYSAALVIKNTIYTILQEEGIL